MKKAHTLIVGYSTTWLDRVQKALSLSCRCTIRTDKIGALQAQVDAAIAKEEGRLEDSFDLYIFGGNLLSEKNVALELLREANAPEVSDTTPTIVFSHEVAESTISEIVRLGGIYIDANEPRAADALQQEIEKQLKR